MSIEERLAARGIELGEPRPPRGDYVPATRHGSVLYLSGQATDRHQGAVGADVGVDEGAAAAEDCVLNVLAQARGALGTLDDVEQVLKLTGYVACAPGFADVSAVVDGASRAFAELLGPQVGVHARTSVGVVALPGGAPVELDVVLKVKR